MAFFLFFLASAIRTLSLSESFFFSWLSQGLTDPRSQLVGWRGLEGPAEERAQFRNTWSASGACAHKLPSNWVQLWEWVTLEKMSILVNSTTYQHMHNAWLTIKSIKIIHHRIEAMTRTRTANKVGELLVPYSEHTHSKPSNLIWVVQWQTRLSVRLPQGQAAPIGQWSLEQKL